MPTEGLRGNLSLGLTGNHGHTQKVPEKNATGDILDKAEAFSD